MSESLEMSRQKQFTMRVSAEEAQQLDELSESTGASVSDLLRKLVRKEHAAQALRRQPWPLQYMHGKLREIVSALILADDPTTVTYCFTTLSTTIAQDGKLIEDEDARASWQRILDLVEPTAADAKQKGAAEHGTMPIRVARLTRAEKAEIARRLWDVLAYLDQEATRRSWRSM
jgi:hypothetical protein